MLRLVCRHPLRPLQSHIPTLLDVAAMPLGAAVMHDVPTERCNLLWPAQWWKCRVWFRLQAAIAHVKCHRAFAGTQGFSGMDSCPMYVKKVNVTADAKARTVDFTVDDPDLVEDLRARAAAHVAP